MTTTHQTHDPSNPGQTDSLHKLRRLKFPEDLSGKFVLDIGCNEGFFSNIAIQKNADSVVGIDIDDKFLNEAKKRYQSPKLVFIRQDWSQLPDGKYDLILWTSTMHYELDPLSVLRKISDRLSDDGLFILECGIIKADSREMISSSRPDGSHWYPTLNLLTDLLDYAGLTYRIVSDSELTGTDPVPRFVLHCHKRFPTVVLITGESGIGKTVLANLLSISATKLVKLDYVISRIAQFTYAHTKLHKVIKERYDPNDLSKIYNSIDELGLTDEYIEFLLKNVGASDKLVVYEGFLTTKQIISFKKYKKRKICLWISERSIS